MQRKVKPVIIKSDVGVCYRAIQITVRVSSPPREKENSVVEVQDQKANQLTVPERVELCPCGISGECNNIRNVKPCSDNGGEVAYLRRNIGFIVVRDKDNRTGNMG